MLVYLDNDDGPDSEKEEKGTEANLISELETYWRTDRQSRYQRRRSDERVALCFYCPRASDVNQLLLFSIPPSEFHCFLSPGLEQLEVSI